MREHITCCDLSEPFRSDPWMSETIAVIIWSLDCMSEPCTSEALMHERNE